MNPIFLLCYQRIVANLKTMFVLTTHACVWRLNPRISLAIGFFVQYRMENCPHRTTKNVWSLFDCNEKISSKRTPPQNPIIQSLGSQAGVGPFVKIYNISFFNSFLGYTLQYIKWRISSISIMPMSTSPIPPMRVFVITANASGLSLVTCAWSKPHRWQRLIGYSLLPPELL